MDRKPVVTTPAFSVMPASLRDLGPLRELERVCFQQDAWPLLDLVGVLTLPHTVRLKAVDTDNTMIGFVGGDPRERQGIGWIITIGVLPAYRRLGVASALLDASEVQLGTPRIRLSVRRSNHAAVHLYERRGYHLVDVWPRYYAGGEDALVLEKQMPAKVTLS